MNTRTLTRLIITACMLACLATTTQAQRMYDSSGRPIGRIDGERMPVRHAPPELGEGTQAVLSGLLGLDEVELKIL